MARGSLPDAHQALFRALQAVRDTSAPELHVYDLWRPDMALPAIWMWMAPGSVPRRPDLCTVRNVDVLVISIGVDPAAIVTDDARRLLDYVQLVREGIDPIVYAARPLDGQHQAEWAAGQQTVQDELGGVPILTAELPVAITLDRTVNPAT